MGAVDTTYTFAATDTITSTKMNNIIDQTVMTADALLGSSGGSGGLSIADGKLTISSGAINSSRLATGSVTTDAIADGQVTSAKIADGTIVNADISPTAAIAGTKISASFGTQGITATGNLGLYGSSSNYTAAALVNTSGVETQLYASGNTNGGISTITNHPLTLSTNNTERMRITAAGNVGIGTTTPYSKLTVSNDNQDGVTLFSSGNDTIVQLGGFNNSGDGSSRIRYYRGTGVLEFSTGTRDAYTQRMFIDGQGQIGLGSGLSGNALNAVHINGGLRYTATNAAGSGSYLMIDGNGDVKPLGSSLRYKNSITDYSKGLDDIKKLRPVTYKFNGEDVVTAGFIAEEVDAIGMDEYVIKNSEGQADALNYGQMVALLVNGIKELSAKVDELEGRISNNA